MLLGLVEHHDDARRGGVVEQVLRQQDDGFDPVVLDELLADIALFVRALVAAAPGDGAGIQHHRHPSLGRKRSRHVLHPTPIGAGGGWNAVAEAPEGIVLVDIRAELLVPHRVGGDQVEASASRRLG